MERRRVLAFVLSVLVATGVAASGYDDDRGFRHPGGLHTQADFDRVKAQIAAGNERVTAAYQMLKTAAYAQPGVQTYPVETIVRGGGSGENYINAARGATMAYQNALRWKIEGSEACARGAVRILMAWARTTKAITGNSDQCLAVGLYGYEFAQAAELMRDYEGCATATARGRTPTSGGRHRATTGRTGDCATPCAWCRSVCCATTCSSTTRA